MNEQIDFTKRCKQIDKSCNKLPKKAKNNTFHQNNTAIFTFIEKLELQANIKILEIGSDHMEHLPLLFQKANGMHYYSASISEVQLQKVLSSNALTNGEKWSQFIKIEENGTLEFPNDFFGYCFSVNSIYFWENPLRYFKEIYRVLAIGGKFDLAFIEKKFGADLPWTHADFTFYEINQVKDFFHQAGFATIEAKEMTEEITDKYGKVVTRPFLILSGNK